MSKVLLINPSHRPKRRAARKAASPAQRRARAAFAAAARGRRKNPARRRAAVRVSHVAHHRHRARRRNPIHALARRRVHHRRRRNPIALGGHRLTVNSVMGMFKEAMIGGAGAVAMDLVMGQVNKYLPDALKSDPNSVGIGDAVKAVATAVIGQGLSKMTRGLSRKAAAGALAVQAADILRSFLPSTMTVGYFSPTRIVNGNPRINASRGYIAPGMGRYLPPGGQTQLLNRYMAPGSSQLLSGMPSRNSNVRVRG